MVEKNTKKKKILWHRKSLWNPNFGVRKWSSPTPHQASLLVWLGSEISLPRWSAFGCLRNSWIPMRQSTILVPLGQPSSFVLLSTIVYSTHDLCFKYKILTNKIPLWLSLNSPWNGPWDERVWGKLFIREVSELWLGLRWSQIVSEVIWG